MLAIDGMWSKYILTSTPRDIDAAGASAVSCAFAEAFAAALVAPTSSCAQADSDCLATAAGARVCGACQEGSSGAYCLNSQVTPAFSHTFCTLQKAEERGTTSLQPCALS